MRPPGPALALRFGVLGCAGLLASCTAAKRPGELVALVTTDLSVPKDIDTLHVTVSLSSGERLLDHQYPLGFTELRLPATLGLVSGPHTTTPVTIQVSGLLAGVPRVSRQAIVTVPTDRVATLPLPLDWLCLGTACPSGKTCQAGACISATGITVPKDYMPAKGNDGAAEGGGSACFDTAACFASATLWLSPFGGDCTVPKPTAGAGVNVALVVRGGGGTCRLGTCLAPLDAESAEGWQTSADGTRIELPLAACTNADVTAVEVAAACATKPDNAAICQGASEPTTDGGCAATEDGGCPGGYVCETSAGRSGQCVLADSGLSGPQCHPNASVPCLGAARGYDRCSQPDPALRCAHSPGCNIPGSCCVSAADAGACPAKAGALGDLIDDMTRGAPNSCGGAQINLASVPVGAKGGYWFTADDDAGSGSMLPTPLADFTFTPVAATCATPFSNAACMKSVMPYQSPYPKEYALMGFHFAGLDATRDGGMTLIYPVGAYRGIRFWAMASDGTAQSVSVQFIDVENDMSAAGAACANNIPPTGCYNFFQSTLTLTSTWSQYEVDFDTLTQRLTLAQGFYVRQQFDQNAALGIQFVVDQPDVLPPARRPLTFDLCVAEIYFVPK